MTTSDAVKHDDQPRRCPLRRPGRGRALAPATGAAGDRRADPGRGECLRHAAGPTAGHRARRTPGLPGVDPAGVPAILDVLTGQGLLTESSQRPRRYPPVAPQHALLRWSAALGSATSQVRMLCRRRSRPAPPGRTRPNWTCWPRASRYGASTTTLACPARRAGPPHSRDRRWPVGPGHQPGPPPPADHRQQLHVHFAGRPATQLRAARRPPRRAARRPGHALRAGLDHRPAPRLRPSPNGWPPVLHNPTTRTILGLLAAGLTDRSIARRLR